MLIPRQQNLWTITKEEDTLWYLPLLLSCLRGVEVYTPFPQKAPRGYFLSAASFSSSRS